MAPSRDDDWSDSDEEELSEVETNVLLGVPDGHVDVGIDVLDAAVSRIGGLPMAGGGSFGGNNGNMFGLGAQIFGGAPLLDESKPETVPEDQAKSFKEEQLLNNEDDECDSDADSEESLLTAMASTAIGESPWRSAPSYPAIYLSTMTEYLPAQPKPQIPKGVAMEDLGDDDKKEKGISWAKETYENSLDVDQVFERFTKRVGVEAEQCVRYELKGTPLPFASDRTFDLLWPAPKEDPLPVTKPDFEVVHSQPREYKTTDVPLCPSCNSKRVFECQLMPNLINVLRPTWEAEEKANKLTDVERRKAVERALKGLDKDQKRGMEWGTYDEFVETSDVEELEELQKNGRRLSKGSSPKSSFVNLRSAESPPRKRMKLFHEDAANDHEPKPTALTTSSPLKAILSTSRNSLQEDMMTEDRLSRATISSAKSIFTTRTSPSPIRSQSSSTLPVTTSPSPGFISSRSPTHTPPSGFEDSGKKWDEKVLAKVSAPSPEKPQDSLLLDLSSRSPSPMSSQASPSRPPLASIPLNEGLEMVVDSPKRAMISPRQTMNPSTPHYEFAAPHSQSPVPLSLFHLSPSPSRIQPKSPSPASTSPIAAASSADELLMFSPTRSASRPTSLSPQSAACNSSLAAQSQPSSPAPERSAHPSSRPSPVNPPSRGRTEDDALSAATIRAIVQEEQQSSRYSLRQRQPAQLRPYTLDQIHYVQALQDNPEAIIKLRNLPLHRHRHPDDHYEEDETQQDHDTEWEAQERKRLRREELRRQTETERHSGGRSSHESHCRYDALLPDLPSTDEEDREMDAVAKEARKILRAKEKQRKAKEKEGRQRQRVEKTHNPKPYPFSNARSPRGATPGPSGRGASSSRNDDPTAQEDHDSLFSSRGVTPHFPSPGPSFMNARRSSTRSPSPSNDDNVLRGYFHEDDDFYMDDPNEAPKHEITEITEPESDQPATLPPTSSSPRILHEDVIELDLCDDQPQAKRDSRHSSISSAGSPEILLDLPKSKRRVLGKMMPAFMINKLIQKGESFSKIKPDKRVRSPSPFPEHAGPLAPGETRVRKIANPKDIGDIKGDSESEDELRPVSGSGSSSSAGGHSSSEDSGSDSDDVEILHTYRHRSMPKPTPEVIDLVHHVSASENSSDDDDIQFFVHREKPAYRRKVTKKMGDQSLIDWMLPRVRTIGGNGKDRQQAKSERRRRRHRPSGYRIDVMTRGSRGHGKERQTLLSFDKFEEKKHKHRIDPIVVNWRSGTGGPKSAKQSAGDQESPFHEDAGRHALPETGDYVMTVPENGSKLSRKEREKLRRAQAKKNGIYNFSSGGGRRVTTGRSRDNTFTVDLEDEGFHRALAPLSAGSAAGCEHPKKYEAPLLKKVKTYSETRSTGIAQSSELAPSQGSLLDQFSNSSQPKESNSVHIAVDLNICRLPSGKSLSPSSYIRRGRLHELTNVVFGNREPPAPVSTILRGYDIGPTMGVEKLCSLLPKLCDSFLDFSGGLPDPDFDELVVQWKQVAHVLPHLVSWYLKTSEETYKALLRETVEREILRLVDELEKSTLTFIDIPVLTTAWFAVDMASRLLSFPSTLPSSSGLPRPLKASSTLLMRFLLQSDIRKVSDVVQSDNGLDNRSRDAYAAELWVCLIHLLNGTTQEVQTKAPKSYAFWTILTDLVQAKVKIFNAAQSLKVSENIWLTIFTVCSLSQFSIHGMTTGEPRLPACWDLVALALKTIRLTDSAEQLRDLNPVKLQLRDRYVGLVTSRCAHLREKWHWRLDDGSPMFNQLAEIFRSRNFANLRHEDEKKMPKFFVARNWEYLSAYSSLETAFSIFLKLIVQAAQDDEKNTGRKSSAKVKKLLSLAVPLGSLPFSKTNPPTRRDFTMYWNRLSAVAVSIFLDQNDYEDRTKKARHYVAFEDADYTTRHLIICGIVRLTALLITRGIQVTAMIEWIEHIAKTLQPEVKEFMSKEWNQAFDPSEISKADPIRLTSHLIASVGQIISSYKDTRQYPTAGLLLALKPLLMLAITKTEVSRPSLGYLASEIFATRSLVLPKPPRPARSPRATVVEEESQESQDFGGIDLDLDGMDWDAPDLAEALGDAPSSTPNPERIQKENALRDALSTTQFKWLVYSHLKQYLQPPPSNVVRKDHVKACDQWLRLWLCCADIETQPTKWAHCLSLVDSLTKTVGDEVWISRVNLSTMYQLLQLDPMAYLMQIDRAMEAFFLALVSCSLDLENGYVSLLLSIDNLAHPLFANATCLPSRKAESGDFEFATEEFVQLRLSLVQVIFRNLNESLLRQVAGNRDLEPENQRYLDLCTKMFSTMRSTRTALLQKDGTFDKLQNYNEFCKQIFSAFEENLQLAKDPSFEFWVGWVRTLAM
ncbi:hypothetical protein NLJ89_g1556 [Agrocybe chaxingu]|uniref:Programmed cell death protein 2 C-terminal domain-containing protein n=1 Tax=Agrocybe chaxingu TaxID=84603 RepID=A0A9W8TEZ8_9AGAR|nr:hypothetical protein NLJ89_g1556 [Agrocybe chaxingu]